MSRLPLTVISGYLGAGKTTLINRLLAGDHGLRLAVLVNDFGAINIDAALLASASADTIELTNGCVCCAMTGDLFFAIGDMLDRDQRPDHLIIEASGIADPAKIAGVARAEPDLRYGGIVTLVDGINFTAQLKAPRIADQVRSQVVGADFVSITKTREPDPATRAALLDLGVSHWLDASDAEAIAEILRARPDPSVARSARGSHPGYVTWALEDPPATSGPALRDALSRAPEGVLRIKGLLPAMEGGFLEAHLVGRTVDVTRHETEKSTGLVAIGLDGLVTSEEIAAWWDRECQRAGTDAPAREVLRP